MTDASNVSVCGYSERGLFNSLFYEISKHPDSLVIIGNFFELVKFADTNMEDRLELLLKSLKSAEVLIEQSLSDFGDADAIALLSSDKCKSTLFIEGKVASQQNWNIDKEWKKFEQSIEKENGWSSENRCSSNLFVQLYYKMRFADEACVSAVKELAVTFPKCSKKSVRKIGRNPTVIKATNKIKKYLKDPHSQSFYIAFIPDMPYEAKQFFDSLEQKCLVFNVDTAGWESRYAEGWHTANIGYICWNSIELFCIENKLNNTMKVFNDNCGQIYKRKCD